MIARIEAADRMALFAREGRLIQGGWHRERDGRELACLIGAIGPDVFDPRDCPASVMPAWLAHLLPGLFDGVRPERAVEFGLRFAAALRAKPVGDVVRDRWLARVVELAKAAAARAAAAADAAASGAAAHAAARAAAWAADAAADAAEFAAAAAAHAAADANVAAASGAAASGAAASGAAADADVRAAANVAARTDTYEIMFNWLIEEMEA